MTAIYLADIVVARSHLLLSLQSRNAAGVMTVGVGFNMETPTAKKVFKQYLPGVNYDNVFFGRECLTQAQVDSLFQYSIGVAAAAAWVRTRANTRAAAASNRRR
jgi:hypothetical protein